jgi:hypothetical protein
MPLNRHKNRRRGGFRMNEILKIVRLITGDVVRLILILSRPPRLSPRHILISGVSSAHLSLYDEIALVVDVALRVGSDQLAVELGALQALATSRGGGDPAAFGQVEVRRCQHFRPNRVGQLQRH